MLEMHGFPHASKHQRMMYSGRICGFTHCCQMEFKAVFLIKTSTGAEPHVHDVEEGEPLPVMLVKAGSLWSECLKLSNFACFGLRNPWLTLVFNLGVLSDVTLAACPDK